MNHPIEYFIGKTFQIGPPGNDYRYTAFLHEETNTVMFRHDWDDSMEGGGYWTIDKLNKELEEGYFIQVYTEVSSYPIC